MRTYLTVIIICASFTLPAQTKKVLFLGNSYTGANNLPQIIADVASSAGDTLVWDRNTPGGYTLQGHSTNSTTISMIAQGDWDFVVLQEQSQRPAMQDQFVQTFVFPYAAILDSLINYYNPCAETMFYMTWGRKNGDAQNCPTWPPVCTYEGMDSLLHLRYMMMADSNDAIVSPVGTVWKYIRIFHPEIELYTQDESHPSEAGSYAAACSFYSAIFRKDPTEVSYNYTLEPTEAEKIRNAARFIVYDSLMHWHIGEYDVNSAFNYFQVNEMTYQFLNQSTNHYGQLWDFGPASDTASNPIYSFPEEGTYTVNLYAFDACDTVVSSADIIIVSSNTETILGDHRNLWVYPNPASTKIWFSHIDQIDLYSLNGGAYYSYIVKGKQELNISAMQSGLYIIRLIGGNQSYSSKLLINH